MSMLVMYRIGTRLLTARCLSASLDRLIPRSIDGYWGAPAGPLRLAGRPHGATSDQRQCNDICRMTAANPTCKNIVLVEGDQRNGQGIQYKNSIKEGQRTQTK